MFNSSVLGSNDTADDDTDLAAALGSDSGFTGEVLAGRNWDARYWRVF
jgi:hypothetical protein